MGHPGESGAVVTAWHRMLRTALRGLRRHRMRSALTCLGIVIGVGAAIATMEIGQGSAYMVHQAIASMGASVLIVTPSYVMRAGASTGNGGGVTLTPADAEAIERECGAVRWAAPAVDSRPQVIYGRRNWQPNDVLGTTPDFFWVRNLTTPAEGELFTEADVRSAARVCLVGQTLVRELFDGESPVGKEIRVRNVAMKVVGVLSAKGANIMGWDQDDYIAAPWTTVKYQLFGSRADTTAANATGSGVNTLSNLYPCREVQLYPQPSAVQMVDMPKLVRFTDVNSIWVSAVSPRQVPQAIGQITELLRERHKLAEGREDDFQIWNMTEITETLAKAGRLMIQLLLGLATISLTVGGVGILNIMLASVTERTHEIGLRMAVGARSRDILRQFLIEAMMLCLLGGTVGILVGHGVSLALL